MEWIIAIVAAVVGLGLAAAYFLCDEAFYRTIGWLFRMLGLQSGKGPLVIHTTTHGEKLILTLENQGTDRLKLAAVEGRDGNQKRHFPRPYLDEESFRSASAKNVAQQFSKIALGPGESRTFILDLAQLTNMDCRTLAVLDTNGHAWPVEGFSETPNSF
jgi:hypothetical protein